MNTEINVNRSISEDDFRMLENNIVKLEERIKELETQLKKYKEVYIVNDTGHCGDEFIAKVFSTYEEAQKYKDIYKCDDIEDFIVHDSCEHVIITDKIEELIHYTLTSEDANRIRNLHNEGKITMEFVDKIEDHAVTRTAESRRAISQMILDLYIKGDDKW